MADFEYEINRSLVRPRLPCGVEPIALFVGVVTPWGIAFLLATTGTSYTYAGVLACIGALGWFGGRKMAKADPYMCRVYLRSWRYKRMYAPRPTLHRRYRKSWRKAAS